MQQEFIIGNQFQTYMGAKFKVDLNSISAAMANVKGKESLVYGYINNLASVFQMVKYGGLNPNGLYADYNIFKKDFVRYWRKALGISKEDSVKIEKIFEDAVTTQESCKKRTGMSVFFENDKALVAEDCLFAIYDVMEMV